MISAFSLRRARERRKKSRHTAELTRSRFASLPHPSHSSLDKPRRANNFQPALRVLCNTEPGPPGVGLAWFVCHFLRPQQDLVYLARVCSAKIPKPLDDKMGDHPKYGHHGGGGHHSGGQTEAEKAREQTMEATQRRLLREATTAEARATNEAHASLTLLSVPHMYPHLRRLFFN